jgi:hypothetical protein
MIRRTTVYTAFWCALMLTASVAPVWAQGTPREAITPSIMVSGTGEIKVKPDIARIDLGVQTQDKDSAKAVQQNASIADAVIKAVRAAGVAESDIQTTNYSIQPLYDFLQPKPGESQGQQVFRGYQVMNTVRVTVRKLAITGNVIDAATKAGANWSGGISLDLNDADKQKAEDAALAKAVADASRKAEIIAKAAGVSSLRLITISEGGGGSNPVPMMGRAEFAMAKAPTPIVAGEQTISASVSVRYSFGQ